MKRWLGVALKFAISAFLIGFLLGSVDLDDAASRLAGVSLPLVAASILILTCQIGLNTVRWQWVLTAMTSPLPFAKALQIVYIGTFFNQTLPSSVGGDAVRMYKAYRAGLSLSGAINGVMLERLATVLGLVLLVALVQPFLLGRMNGAVPVWLFPLIALAGIVGTLVLTTLDRLPERFNRWRLVRGLAHLAADTRRVFLRPFHLSRITVLSILGHANVAVSVWVLGLALGLGDQLGLLDCLVLVPPVMLVTILPISIAGWGVREGAMVAALGIIGIAAESALVLSILFGLVVIATSLPGGVVWLTSSDRRMPKEGEFTLEEEGEIDEARETARKAADGLREN